MEAGIANKNTKGGPPQARPTYPATRRIVNNSNVLAKYHRCRD